MSKPIAPLLSFRADGTVGKKVTFSHTLQGTVAKRIPTHPDARTLAQLYQRWRFRDAVYYWRSLSDAQRLAYAAASPSRQLSGWAYFLSIYLADPIDQVLHLHLDETGGATVKDYAGEGNDGTIYGALPTDGVIAGAYDFDGIDDRIVVPNDDSLNNMADATLMCWCRPETLADNHGMLIDKGAYDLSAYNIFITDLDAAIFQVGDGDVTYANVNRPITLHIWQHLTLKAISNDAVYAYVNGTFGSSSPMAFTLGGWTHPLRIGVRADSWAKWFHGDTDDIRLYNRGLTDEQIYEIATTQRYPYPPN